MGLRKQEPTNINVVYGYFMFDVLRRIGNSYASVGPWLNNSRNMSSACYSTGAGSSIAYKGSLQNEHLDKSAALSDRTSVGERDLKLLSGSCYLPYPDKEATGGEDAHFVCVDEQAIGVADGVSGWAEVGVNVGLYAQELMSYSVTAIEEDLKGSIDPARVLEKAHSSTRTKGSLTACILALVDEEIHAINLGDSGFIVVMVEVVEASLEDYEEVIRIWSSGSTGGAPWWTYWSADFVPILLKQVAQVLFTLPYSFSQLRMVSGILFQLFYGLMGSWTAYLISILY